MLKKGKGSMLVELVGLFLLFVSTYRDTEFLGGGNWEMDLLVIAEYRELGVGGNLEAISSGI